MAMRTKLLIVGVVTLMACIVTWANDDTRTEDSTLSKDSATQSNIGADQVRASALIGSIVRNKQDDELGQIDDLLLDKEGTTVRAVIAVHGFLGVDEKLVTVSYSDLQLNIDTDYVIYDATREELETKPEFKYRPREVPWTDSDADKSQGDPVDQENNNSS